MSDDVQLSCAACHLPAEDDAKETMTACRLCGRIHCHSCVDEYGRCVDCREDEAKKGPQQ